MAHRFSFVAFATAALVGTVALDSVEGQQRPPAGQGKRTAQGDARPAITDPVTRFTLANGLNVIVQTSTRVPLITATVVYNVGSKDEKSGQHGYAHLFEHLMLDGSEHWDQNAFVSLRDLGATNSNATTTQDVTTLYETFPSAALERVLFLEADRMGYIGGALTPERVKREVGVVLSEKRLRASRPDGTDEAIILGDLYPEDHPYHHSVIGQQADLNAVTVEKAREWFDSYYGPSNATLILAGDVSAQDARRLVEKYFGGLAPRLPVDRLVTRVTPLSGAVRRVLYRDVPQGRIYANYVAPPQGTPAIAALDLTAQIMAAGARSRLNRRLIEELGIAKTAFVTFNEGRLASQMGFVVDGITPDQMARAEAEIDAVLAEYVAKGPTPDELERARTARTQYLFGLQSSTSSKAFLLARAVGQTVDPNYAESYLRDLRAATPDSVRKVAEEVYGRPGYRLIVRPKPALQAAPGGYDLTKGPPPMGPMATIAFPAVERAQLSNGLKVVLVPRLDSMSDSVLLRFDDAGTAGPSRMVGRIGFGLLANQGTTPLQRMRAERAETLKGWLTGAAEPDHADLRVGWDVADRSAGLAFLADAVTKPDLSTEGVAGLKAAETQQLAGQSGNALANRALFNAIYGAGHPYAPAPVPAQDAAALGAVDVAAVRDWYRARIRPDRATLYVAADTTMAALRPQLEKAFAGWTAQGAPAPATTIPAAQGAATPSLTVIDRPGAAQTFIMAGRALPAADTPDGLDATAAWAANEIYGGNSSARISSNLRVDKGWTYGIGSGLYDTEGERRWIMAGTVNRDHSGDSVAELIGEMQGLAGARGPTQSELTRLATTAANQSAAKLEGAGELLAAMADAQSEGLPVDDVVRQPARLQALTPDQVRQAAARLFDPAKIHWVLVGDWQRIRDQFSKLDLGTPVVIAPDR